MPFGVYNVTATVSSNGFDGFQTFTKLGLITIPSSGTATPYPSPLVVAGLPAGASVSSVQLVNFNHTWAGDVDIALTGPTFTAGGNTQAAMLLSDLGNDALVNATNVNLTFSDAAAGFVPATSPMVSGTYKCTNNGAVVDAMPAPGPTTIAANPLLTQLNSATMNGTWNLWINDQVPGDQGNVGSWSITFKYPTVGCTSPPRTVVVTVNTQAIISTQPVNTTVCTDKVATFNVVASIGLGAISYRWMVSTDNGNTYTNINDGGVYSGATTNTLTITQPPVAMSGYYYRCTLQGPAPCASIFSFFRILTVNPLPTVVITASPYTRLFPGLITTLSSTVSPFAAATYTWFRDGVVVNGANGATLSRDVDGLGDYTLRVTDVNGCTNTSNLVSLRDSISGNCFLYPNPNKGKFQVRYHSAAGNVLPRSVTVYDGKGTRVLTQFFTVVAPYARMDLDLTRYGKGVFWVEIGDLNGKRIIVCRAVVD